MFVRARFSFLENKNGEIEQQIDRNSTPEGTAFWYMASKKEGMKLLMN